MNRYDDVISVAVSLLVGIAFAILTYLDLLVTGITAPVIALALSFFALSTAAYSRVHGGRCICLTPRLIIAALALAAVAVVALVLAAPALEVALIIAFVIFALISYVLFCLYGFLTCWEKRVSELPGSCR